MSDKKMKHVWMIEDVPAPPGTATKEDGGIPNDNEQRTVVRGNY